MNKIENDVLEGREVVYSVLSKIFLDSPDKNMYDMVKNVFPLMQNFISDDLSQNVFSQLNTFIESNFTDEYLLNWQRDYTSLFCLTSCVPVSESYYTSVERLVMQESREQVLSIYKKYRFSMDYDSNEPEDHISYELMFMSFLSKQLRLTNDENKQNDLINTQIQFIDEHLLILAKAFTEKMSMFEQSNKFYLPVSLFMIEFIKADYEYLKSILDK